MFKHILLPTDGSKLSTDAAEDGVRLAKALGARVSAMFAAPPATPIIYKGMLPVGYATPEEHRKTYEFASLHLAPEAAAVAAPASQPAETNSGGSEAAED